ncbi:MAG: hypothetical protein JXR97_04225, partial [Planctomycetes bacterium]|nr:hypothetical protein [Planctomycetota bacterium]
ESRDLIVIGKSHREGEELSAAPDTLQRFADVCGGEAGDFTKTERIITGMLDAVESKEARTAEVYRLWDNYLVIILMAGLLYLEWSMRKRLGLP